MRLDKFLAASGFGSRKEVKKLINQGSVTINETTAKKPNAQIDPYQDTIAYLGDPIHYQAYYYVLLNKPDGIISATEDREHETVIDWVALDYHHVDLFPVGRLDIDTTGLLLLTNNGQLSHQLLSPKKKVPKTYHALIDGIVTQDDIEAFDKGLNLGDFTTQPALLKIDEVDEEMNQTAIQVTIYEGKFHQVKRMFEAVGKTVLQLHRHSMGPLELDSELAIGEYRELTDREKQLLIPYGLIDK